MNKQKLFVIGSLSQMKDIEYAAQKYRKQGYTVKHVRPMPDMPFDTILDRTIRTIYKSDVIAVVKKPSGSVGTGTAYELAMAKFFKKEILYYDKNFSLEGKMNPPE